MRPTNADRPAVLICSAWPPAVGGAASFATRIAADPHLARCFDVRGWQVLKRPSVFIDGDKPYAARAWAPFARAGFGALNGAGYLGRLFRERPAVVQYHYNARFRGPLFLEACFYLWAAKLVGAGTAMRLGAPFHFFDLDPSSAESDQLKRRLLRRLDLLIVQTDDWRDAYRQWLKAARLSTTCIAVPNTVDIREYAPQNVAPREVITIGCIAGPETSVKGGFVLLEALRLVGAIPGLPPIRLLAVGATREFCEHSDRLGLQDTVTTFPILRGAAKQDWLRSLDIFVLASLAEGFPNIMLEVMASGIAIVATRVGAIPSVVDDGRNGCLVSPNDPSAICAAIARLLTHPALREQLASEALVKVRSKFDSAGPWTAELGAEWKRIAYRM